MTDIIEALLKFFVEFSWRRLVAVLIVTILIVFGFLMYERYTSGFRLGRLQKQAELLAALNQLHAANIRADPRLTQMYDRLVVDTDAASQTEPLSITFFSLPAGMFTNGIAKFFAGAAPWAFIGVFFIRGIFRGDKSSGSAFLGMIVFVVLFGTIGAALPTIWWPWFNLWIYPICHFLLFLLGVLIYSIRATRKQRQSNATQSAS